MPVLQGTDHDEGRLFVPADFDAVFGGTPNPTVFEPGVPAQALINSNTETFQQELAGVVGSANATILTSKPLPKTVTAPYSPAAFPNADFRNQPSADEALSAAFTDEVFSCNGLELNNFLKDFVPVYAYEFHDPNAPNLFQPLIGFSFGSSHASELQYLFDQATLQGPFDAAANRSVVVPPGDGPSNAVQPPPLTPGGTLLAKQMKAYWANFVKTTTPNRLGLALWPPFSGEVSWIQQLTPTLLRFPLDARRFSDEHNCGFGDESLSPGNVRTVGCVGDALPQARRRSSRAHPPRGAFSARYVLISGLSSADARSPAHTRRSQRCCRLRGLRPAVSGRKRVHDLDKYMAAIAADRIVRHLENAGYVVMKKPPIVGSSPTSYPEGWPHTKP